MAKQSILTNMFSLINPYHPSLPWPVSVDLPSLFEELERVKYNGKQMVNSRCQHLTRKHYARNMCRPCYHRKGRFRKAWMCKHSDRAVYARGLCCKCYMKWYYTEKLTEDH
mmetsp:Transcript_10066/g.19831  ORF Transcript_10066/g.19831 Transcript_10066/m.19831 type:complete len:111 (+) Transcript_10066:25-357(+)